MVNIKEKRKPMKIINLTGEDIKIDDKWYDSQGVTSIVSYEEGYKEESYAFVSWNAHTITDSFIDDIPLYRPSISDGDLPDFKENVYYIVGDDVREFLSDRKDVLSFDSEKECFIGN